MRWLRALLPDQTRGRRHRRDHEFRRPLPAARRRDLPVHRLSQPQGQGAGLHPARCRERQVHQLDSDDLRLPASGGRQRPGVVASAGVRRPEHGRHRRHLGYRPHGGRGRRAAERMGRPYRDVAGVGSGRRTATGVARGGAPANAASRGCAGRSRSLRRRLCRVRRGSVRRVRPATALRRVRRWCR